MCNVNKRECTIYSEINQVEDTNIFYFDKRNGLFSVIQVLRNILTRSIMYTTSGILQEDLQKQNYLQMKAYI